MPLPTPVGRRPLRQMLVRTMSHTLYRLRRRLTAAHHELRDPECRVTWYSWALRLLGIGGMSPHAKNWRRN